MKAEIEEAARRPYVYDPDCPLLTEEQLAQFKPVNFATMEERAEAMKAAGIIIDVDEKKEVIQKEPALV
jgi:DNA-binding transcriptional regulator YhcF (GntR family)